MGKGESGVSQGEKETYLRIMKDLDSINLRIKKEIGEMTGSTYFTFIDINGKEKPCNVYTKELLGV